MGVLFVVADFYIASRSFHVGRNIRFGQQRIQFADVLLQAGAHPVRGGVDGWVDSVCAWQATPGSVVASTSSVFPINFLQCSVPTQAAHFT